MPHFVLYVVASRAGVRDKLALELPDLEAARFAARFVLARRALDAATNDQPYPEYDAIEICDAGGRVLDIEWCWCLVRNPTPVQADKRAGTHAVPAVQGPDERRRRLRFPGGRLH